jgi:predicted transcriptional regulator
MSRSKDNPKFVVRLPDDLRDRVDAAAQAADMSMNSVFVRAVRQYLDDQKRQALLLDALSLAARKMHVEVSNAGA